MRSSAVILCIALVACVQDSPVVDAGPPDVDAGGAAALDGGPKEVADAGPVGPRCGDGVIDDDEVCDDGPLNGQYGACNTACDALGPRCGDALVDDNEVCDDGVNDPLGGGCLPGCQSEDLSDAVFARELLEVEISMDPADYDALRFETKRRHTIFGSADCRNEQIENPYNWYPGTVSIDGVLIENVGFRKKGHLGSLSTTKPSIKLRTDKFVDDQAFEGLTRLAFNNSKSDPAFINMCSAYDIFRAAGYAAPRCMWAHVTLNGEDRGVMVAVEEMKKPFIRRHFRSDEGNLYEGTACDFRPEFFGGFEQEFNERSDPSRADLQAVMDVIESPLDELEGNLEALFNMEALYRFWALESLVWHLDGYGGNSNNYFLYADPADGGRFHFLPWGTDAVFRLDNRGYPDSVLARGRLFNRLYEHPETRAKYYAALEDILSTSFVEADHLVRLDEVEALLSPVMTSEQLALFPAALDERRAFVDGRSARMRAAYAGGFPDWTAGMRTRPCRAPVGSIEMSFSTTWGTRGDPIFDSGTSSIDITLDTQPAFGALSRGGSRVGPQNGRPQLQAIVDNEDQLRWTFTVNFPDTAFFEDALVVGETPLFSPPFSVNGTLRDLAAGQNIYRVDVGEGTFAFTAIETTDGSLVEGTFRGTVYEPAP